MRDDLCPFLDLVTKELGGVGWRPPKHEPSHISQRALYPWISNGRIDMLRTSITPAEVFAGAARPDQVPAS